MKDRKFDSYASNASVNHEGLVGRASRTDWLLTSKFGQRD